MIAAAIDLTMVLDTAIITLPAIIAAIYAARIHSQIKTPSGKTLGAVTEYAHDTAIANNMLLRKANGPTEPATRTQLRDAGATSPSVPTEA